MKGDIMKVRKVHIIAASLCFLVQPLLAQNVKLAKVALGMSDTEVKAALASDKPFFADQFSAYSDMRYLIAETEAESYVFTLIDGKTAAFSVVHLLAPGQLPFLPPGQQPTVQILRGLIAKQTWEPAEISKGDSWWFSDAAGAPLKNGAQCRPRSGDAWLPAGSIPGAKRGEEPPRSTVGLLKPAVTSYPSNCGVCIHLNQAPAENEESVVTSVRYQVLDIKAMNAFVTTHPQHEEK
jgi:hypothetical protein